jgi:epoxyqueuosine reductase
MPLGFARLGVASSHPVEHADVFREWLAQDYHAQMSYMARNVKKRLCPAQLVEGARSVLCLAISYAPGGEETGPTPSHPPADARAFVARYARGRDYHRILKSRCYALMDRIRSVEPTFRGRAFVDSAPVAERSLAAAAGLGWIGRNGCLIAPGLGSYVLLCEIVSNLDLPPDAPLEGGCEGCNACVRACPTGALLGGGLVDARRCVSYLTIEHRGSICTDLRRGLGHRVFGCDRCQEACPHNHCVPAGDPELTALRTPLHDLPLAELLDWTETDWDQATRGSPIRRAKYHALLRNAAVASGNYLAQTTNTQQTLELIPPLTRLTDIGPCQAEARWALGQAPSHP